MSALAVVALGMAPRGAAAADAPRSLGVGVRIDGMQASSPESPFVRAEGPHAPFTDGVEFAVGASLDFSHGVLREVGVDASGEKRALATLVDNALIARVSGSITPLHWLSFDLNMPFGLLVTGDKPQAYGPAAPVAATSPAQGDLRVGAHARVYDTKPIGVFLGGRFWAPTGVGSSYLSDTKLRAEVDLGLAGEVTSMLYGCTFNLAPGFFAQRAGDRLAAGCAVHVKLGKVVSLGVEPSFAVFEQVDTKGAASVAFVVEPLGALHLQLGGFRLGLAGGPGLGGAPGGAQVRGILNLAYVGGGKPPKPPPAGPSDRDLDKILDKDDACPDEAGMASRDPKRNGCPARDRDGDGVPDDEDFCADRAGIPYEDPKANGCPDTDNDGMPDPIDQCKNEPGGAPTGCPKFARLTTAGFVVTPAIEFGKDEKLTPEGRAALDEIAGTMRANPKIEQVSIGVGTKGAKAALSDKRAQEILLILRGGNLDESRYEVLLRDDLKAGNVLVRLVR
jgi:outer membrane protein OmpA-like peptidoglycan-associated protein